MRDYWVAGVGVDFVEEADTSLKPGKVAVVAEVEEEWVIPVDTRMAAAGGVVFRRARVEMAEAQFHQDISVFKAEIAELAGEAKHASDAAKGTLQSKLAAAEAGLARVEQRAKRRGEELTHEVESKVHSLTEQISKSQGKAKTQLEHRVARVKSSFHERSTKLGKAWGLAKEALGA